MEIPFKGQHDWKTFYRAVRLANQPARRGRWTGLLVLAALGALIVLTGQSFFSPEAQDPFNLVRLGLAALLVIAFLGWPGGLALYQARRLWQNPALQQPISGRAGEKGLTYTNTTPYRSVSWESFARLRLSTDLVTLLTPGGVLTVLPRSFFKNDSDWKRFRELAQRKVLQTR
ncbi:MAG: hypothetical protein ACKOC5_05310 [Chloroflexota bacterium]